MKIIELPLFFADNKFGYLNRFWWKLNKPIKGFHNKFEIGGAGFCHEGIYRAFWLNRKHIPVGTTATLSVFSERPNDKAIKVSLEKEKQDNYILYSINDNIAQEDVSIFMESLAREIMGNRQEMTVYCTFTFD